MARVRDGRDVDECEAWELADRDFVLDAMHQPTAHLGVIPHVDPSLRDDVTIITTSFCRYNDTAFWIGPTLRENRPFMQALARRRPFDLFKFSFIPLCRDRAFVVEAIAGTSPTIDVFVPRCFSDDAEIVMMAIEHSGRRRSVHIHWNNLSTSLKNDVEFLTRAMRRSEWFGTSIPKSRLINVRMRLLACDRFNSLEYLSKWLDAATKIVTRAHPSRVETIEGVLDAVAVLSSRVTAVSQWCEEIVAAAYRPFGPLMRLQMDEFFADRNGATKRKRGLPPPPEVHSNSASIDRLFRCGVDAAQLRAAFHPDPVSFEEMRVWYESGVHPALLMHWGLDGAERRSMD